MYLFALKILKYFYLKQTDALKLAFKNSKKKETLEFYYKQSDVKCMNFLSNQIE